MNKTPSIVARLLSPDPILFWAYGLPILYWIYLTLTTNFVFVFDSDSYYELGRMFAGNHWAHYFAMGPNREPFYPLVVAASMLMGQWLGIAYVYPLKVLSFGFLALTMFFIQQALRTINTPRWIQASAILYTGFSPILINSALCLYSEIATFPWLVGAVYYGILYLRSLQTAGHRSLLPAIALSFCLLGFCFVKGIGEGLSPLYLAWILWLGFRQSKLALSVFLKQSKIKIMVLLLVFYIPLCGFKSLNLAFNGHFSLTNRAELVLYGPIVQRAQSSLTLENTLVHITSSAISYPICARFFPEDKCAYWDTDPVFSMADLEDQLQKKNLSKHGEETVVHQAMIKALLSHPFRQLGNFLPDGLRMFFWETTRGSFVAYPPWLERIFYIPWIVVLSTLGIAALCLLGFLVSLTLLDNELILVTFMLLNLFIFLFSFCVIYGRYAIMAGPLMILLNASCVSVLVTRISKIRKSGLKQIN